MKKILYFISLLVCVVCLSEAQNTFSLEVATFISEDIKNQFKPNGRLFLFVSSSRFGEPRQNTWPNSSNKIYALNLKNWDVREPFVFDGLANLDKSVDVGLDALPEGNYRIQVLWDQNPAMAGIDEEGNLYSKAFTVELDKNTTLSLPLEKVTQPPVLNENDFVKLVDIKSGAVSEFWGSEKRIKAAVVLPSGYYDNPEKRYPVRYNIAGYGGRYTRAGRFMREGGRAKEWWMSGEAPQVINVYLDGDGPFGDCYQLDSENSGPYGTALTEELIPYIEKTYRAAGTPESRFLDGCSTGGWVSLALQIFYPDFFNGCFSYSADQVDFENCQLMNIYEDENAFYNEYGYLRPIVRDVDGEPRVSQKNFILFENVLGASGTYLNSGGQFSAFTALFSPKGENGLPKPLFDPFTGAIDHEVAKHWEKYDLKRYVDNNWETLGPKLQGKIWIWMGDMDHFYLNPPMRAFSRMIKAQKDPVSDAEITFAPMQGHCAGYNEMEVLRMIAEKWEKIK